MTRTLSRITEIISRGGAGKGDVSYLIDLLSDHDERVCWAAAELGKIGTAEVVPTLLALSSHDVFDGEENHNR